ncbi:NAD-dependent epimerase/dehydratase family protein [Riemerella columbina]|uniref:NAD-dependent epimerase/dehydratase family protein n=1 Tax=Riemerella columbina TaxID=103810 RepID=UPI0003747EE4|nr:NAD-dependent epimerase/dehydratase family protein [Riemerella columbina]
MSEKILITGALGQIGSELTTKLVSIYGRENVIASDINEGVSVANYEKIDVTQYENLENFIKENGITTVYHLASLLSGTSEKNPLYAWQLNLEPLLHLCELAKEGYLKKIFWPSSIAVFGRGIPEKEVGQEVVLNPSTVYGISKLAGEKWCEYYHEKYNVDVRSIRYPGLISWKTPAGGGTTDYAVEIFYNAVKKGSYTSFIDADTAMPMLYMDDAINATIKLMQAPAENLSVWTSYNLGGLSFTPAELAAEIQKEMPEFKIDYQPDFRQKIAESWPSSIDDVISKKDWGLTYDFDITAMTKDMLKNLKVKLKENSMC